MMTRTTFGISASIRLAVTGVVAAVFAAAASYYLWSGVIRRDPLEGMFALRDAIAPGRLPWSSDLTV